MKKPGAEHHTVLVHADTDVVIPLTEVQRLSSVRSGVQIEMFHDAGHADCLCSELIRYHEPLRTFLSTCFGTIPGRAR